MKKCIMFFSALLMCCAMTTAQTVHENDVPERSGYKFRTEVKTVQEDDEVRWDTIVVHATDAKGHTEMFYTQAMPLDTMYFSRGSIGEVLEDDWNFDGIPDLQVCLGPMNNFGNNTYEVWLWDDKAHKFNILKSNQEIFDPYIDSDNKQIVSTWRLDNDVEIVRYKWKDGELVVSDREQLSYDELTDD